MNQSPYPTESGEGGDQRESPPLDAYGAHEARQETDFGNAPQSSSDHPEKGGLEEQRIQEGLQQRKAREDLFASLNDRQREAVFMANDSALVLAAAGSGKTSVLTARIAHLVTKGSAPVHPRAILAVTFTNKAAIEMRTRLRKLLGERTVNSLWVGTFHSLCNRMLRDNALSAGLPKSFAILDVDGQQSMCRGVLKDLGLTRSIIKEAKKAAARDEVASAQSDLLFDAGANAAAGADSTTPTPEQRLAAAGAVSVAAAAATGIVDGGDAGEFITPAQCAAYINSRKEAGQSSSLPDSVVTHRSKVIEQLEAVFYEYTVRCNRSGLLDFQDLLTRTVKMLEEDRGVRDEMQKRFEFILVDEFQDTNDIQYRWLSLLKSPKACVMAVGDDDQSIYAFRGAKPENMALFLQDMAATKTTAATVPGKMIRLEHNYRSLPHILEIANGVIERNTNRLGKVLRTDKPDRGEKADLAFFVGGNNEAAAVAAEIHDMVRSKGVALSEIAVLYRANMQSRLIEAELNKRNIPLTVYGGFRFYERQEVKFVLAYLSLICDPDHDIAFAKVANFPPRGLGERTLEELRQDAQIKGTTMLQMIVQRGKEREAQAFSFGAVALKKQLILEDFADLILGLFEASEALPLHKLIEETIALSGLQAHYAAEAAESGGVDSDERLANMGELVSAARQYLIDNPEVGKQDTVSQLVDYLAHVALMTSTSESDMNAKNTVSLMTVHSAKGLEFDHVFVTGLEEKSFPHARAIDEDAIWVPENPRDRDREDLDGPSIQEERRLMYVAVTRARKTLLLSHCEQRLLNGEVRGMEPSRFLAELPQHRLRLIDARPKKEAQAQRPGQWAHPGQRGGSHQVNGYRGHQAQTSQPASRAENARLTTAPFSGLVRSPRGASIARAASPTNVRTAVDEIESAPRRESSRG